MKAVVTNGTFLEVVEAFIPMLNAQGIELAAVGTQTTLTADRVREVARDVDVVFGPSRGLDAALFALNPQLKIVSIAASGYESVDVYAATANGVVVTHAPGPLWSEAVADLTWGLMIGAARWIPQAHAAIASSAKEDRHTVRQPRPMGQLLWGKTLGIVGLGEIGTRVAARATGFGMRVLAVSRRQVSPDRKHGSVQLVDLTTLLEESDFVSLHVRETSESRGMIGASELARMKPTACLINTARRSIVDSAALHDALSSGALYAAGLDTAVDEGHDDLIDLPNVVSTPHLGNRNLDAIMEVVGIAIDNVVRLTAGERPARVVNPLVFDAPGLRLPR